MRLKGRVEALEAGTTEWKPWHQIIVPVGDTVEAARARYEAANGPIGEDHSIIVRIVVPGHREATLNA